MIENETLKEKVKKKLFKGSKEKERRKRDRKVKKRQNEQHF